MEKVLSLGRNESFPLRDGWTIKALEAIPRYGKATFSKEDGISILGIGANMVKALKYWLLAGGIVQNDKQSSLSEFGQMLVEKDPYMMSDLSWLLYHYKLVSDMEKAPVFYYVFRKRESDLIDPRNLLENMKSWLAEKDYKFNEKTLEKDINVFLRTYYQENPKVTPEENSVSPLIRLNLFGSRNRQGQYQINKAGNREGMYLLLYYLLLQIYPKNFDIHEAFTAENSVAKPFGINETLFGEYLHEMVSDGLLRIDRTAGLNAAYFLKELSLAELYKAWNEKGGW